MCNRLSTTSQDFCGQSAKAAIDAIEAVSTQEHVVVIVADTGRNTKCIVEALAEVAVISENKGNPPNLFKLEVDDVEFNGWDTSRLNDYKGANLGLAPKNKAGFSKDPRVNDYRAKGRKFK